MTEPAQKNFPTPAVLSAVTGRLVCDIGQVYEVLNWMTGESLFTHQLPRVGREAQPAVLAMHPALAETLDEAEAVTPENWRQYLKRWTDRHGPEMAVPKLSEDQHERIDALSELAEKVHPDRIAVITHD
jgi:hypothetical protein